MLDGSLTKLQHFRQSTNRRLQVLKKRESQQCRTTANQLWVWFLLNENGSRTCSSIKSNPKNSVKYYMRMLAKQFNST